MKSSGAKPRTPIGLLNHTTTPGAYGNQSEGQSDIAIHQLPDDILRFIFTLHCRETPAVIRLPYDDINVAPQITISHVCSIWRHVMLDMPSFWNDFEVFMDYAKDGDMLVEILREWLYRARGTSCALELHFKADDSEFGALKQERWYKSIVKHLIAPFQLRKLRTPLSSNHWVQFLQLPSENLSSIEDLHICCINPPFAKDFGDLPWQAPLDNFKKLTKLTSLRLDQSVRRAFCEMFYLQDSVFVHVSWHQLCHIHLSIPTSVLFCFTILQGSSMVLETCSFVVSDYCSPWTEIRSLYAEPLHCPRLRTLELLVHSIRGQFNPPPILDPILLLIRMPNLKALTVGSRNGVTQRIILFSTLAEMLVVSNMRLEKLTLHIPTSFIDVGDLLANFPSLKRVELTGRTFIDDDEMDQLGSGLIAPCLEEFIVQCDEIDFGKLLRMVKARSNIGKLDPDIWEENEPTSFKYVKLYRWGGVPEECKESIEEINRNVQLAVESWK